MSEATANIDAANRKLAKRLLLVVAGMGGFSYAMVPLYDVFCEITGLNGKTASGPAKVESVVVDLKREITVEFLSSVNEMAPWDFEPKVIKLKVHPGQVYQTSYLAENLTDQPLVGQAIPSVAPGLAAEHFQKTECFCFNRQQFEPGETKDMPLVFMVNPNLPDNINTITLSYTFFKLDEQAKL